MKKTFLTFVLLFSCFTAFTQEKTTFGIGFDANLTHLKIAEREGSQGKFRSGASLSGTARIPLARNLHLQPGIRFNYTEATFRSGRTKDRYKYAAVEIPVLLMGTVPAGNRNVLLGIGPHIGYGFSADTKIERLPQGHPQENVLELDHWYMGCGITAGYEFGNRISLTAGYRVGFDLGASERKDHTLHLGIGYRF